MLLFRVLGVRRGDCLVHRIVSDMNPPDYYPVDDQLLSEIRLALLQGKHLPVSLLRIATARGWVHEPKPCEIVNVRAALEDAPDETLESFSQSLAAPNLTRSGRKELVLHSKYYDDELIESLLGLGSDADEDDEEDED